MVEKLYYLIEQITMIVCLFGLYGKKIKIDILTMCTLVVNMIIFNLMLKGYIGSIYSVIALIVIYIYSIYEFKDSIRLSLTRFFMCIILIMAIQLVSVIPMIVLKMIISSDAVLLLIVNLIILVIIIMNQKKLHSISGFISKNKWLSIIPILFCFVEMIILLINFKVYKCLKLDVYFIETIFTVLVICLIHKWYESKTELELKSHELQVASVYNDTFDKIVDDVRKRQHNIKNHFSAIYSLQYTCHTYEELVSKQKEYCEHIINKGRFDKLLTIKIPILAGFLYSQFNSMEEDGIKIEYNVELETKEIKIPMYEMITILGILLDNAKEKVKTLDIHEQLVKVDIYEDNKNIYFKVKNINESLKVNDMVKLFQDGYSTKGANRGMGLSIVKKKSKEYNFDVSVENEKIDNYNWIVFGIIVNK